MREVEGKTGTVGGMKYKESKIIKKKSENENNDKYWVKVLFDNGFDWIPGIVDVIAILLLIMWCEDKNFPRNEFKKNGMPKEGYKMILKFFKNCKEDVFDVIFSKMEKENFINKHYEVIHETIENIYDKYDPEFKRRRRKKWLIIEYNIIILTIMYYITIFYT